MTHHVKQVVQLPATLPFFEDVDPAELVDECKSCGLGKPPLVDPLVLTDDSQNPAVPDSEDEEPSLNTDSDPWSHLNGLPASCTCDRQ